MSATSILDENFMGGEPEEPAAPAPERQESQEPAGEPQVEAKQPKTPTGRRPKAREAEETILKELGSLKETIAKERETYSERIQRLQEENSQRFAELHRTIQQQPRPEPQRQEPTGPDPDKLLEEANKALDARDFATYQRKFAESVRASTARELAPRFEAMRPQPGPPPINPVLQAVMGNYSDVVSNPRGVVMAQAQDRVLEAQGIPDGPDRWNRAFTEARRVLGGGKPKAATFSTENREVLSGVPTASATERGDSGPGVRLNDTERAYAKKFRIPEERYANHIAAMHPERVEK